MDTCLSQLNDVVKNEKQFQVMKNFLRIMGMVHRSMVLNWSVKTLGH